jgi:hypothetical protein
VNRPVESGNPQIKGEKVNRKNFQKSFERGQSLVEFAVTLAFLLVLLAGTVDAGRAFFTFMALRDAVQEGALYGSYNPTSTALIINRVEKASNVLQELASDPAVTLNIEVELTGEACVGHGITVTATYENFPITMPFLGAILGSQEVPLSASITDTILIPPCP